MTPNSLALVAQVKADLIARGVIPNPQSTNEHAGAITLRVAWLLRSFGARLVLKPSGNHFIFNGVGYGIDFLAFPDGGVDLLVSAGPTKNLNTPAWQWDATKGYGSTSPPNLALPFDPDAGVPPQPVEPPVIPPIEPAPAPAVDLATVSWQIAVLAEQVALLHAVVEHVALVQARGLQGGLFGYTLTLLPSPAAE